MNWDHVRGNWKQLRGRFRQRWGKLTGSDLEQAAGAKDRLVGLLQERYGTAKDRAEQELDEFIAGLEEKAGREDPEVPEEPVVTGHSVREP